jgi:hypothetical protein
MIVDEQMDEKRYDPTQLRHVTERIERLVVGTSAQDNITDLLASLVHTLQTSSEDMGGSDGNPSNPFKARIDGKEAVCKFLQSNTHFMRATAHDRTFHVKSATKLELPTASSKVDVLKWARLVANSLKGASSSEEVKQISFAQGICLV